MSPSSVVYALDLFGVAVFAVSGALAAGRKGMDLFGVMVVSAVTAVGGGTLRDVLLDNRPLFWVRDVNYLLVAFGAAALTLAYVRAFRTPDHVRGLYREKLDGGLAPRTVLHIHRALSKALKQATGDGLIPRNAAALVKPPRPRREEIRPLNREQVQALFEGARRDRLEALYVVAVTGGLRRGELQGLKWEDLDLEAGILQVRRTLSEPKGGYIFEAPKRGKGRNIRLSRGLRWP